LTNFSLKARISALGSAGGAGVCGEECSSNRKVRTRKVETTRYKHERTSRATFISELEEKWKRVEGSDYIVIGSLA
jgi:hypothetical protein